MCDADVRLVVIRKRPIRSKPYRYFCVFTTDLTLEIPDIITYYQQRWQIETTFRDVKQHFGFDAYRLKISQEYQSVRSVEFRCSKSNKVDILNTRGNAKRDKCSGGL